MALIIIGKVLLALLIILVSILFLLLFFPISYRLRMNKEGDQTELKVLFRWLFGLLRGRFYYPEPKRLQLFALWKELNLSNFTSAKNETSASSKKKTSEPGTSEKQSSDHSDKLYSDYTSVDETGTEAEVKKKIAEDRDNRKGNRKTTFIHRIKDKVKQATDWFAHIKDNISKYAAIFTEDSTKALLGDVFTEIKRFLKYLKPKKQFGRLTIGTGSPDTTGYLYGLICMYSHVLGPDFSINPDFENKVFEGRLEISGRITVFMLGIIVLRLYRNKNLPEFLDKFKKKEA